jgi:gamma-glutamyltranspeptidase/glutathione hydrolase
MGQNGMIATSQPLASAAGLRVMHEGGNAIDAAITAAAVLAVVEPNMNGIGGDLFALVYNARTQTLRGLNASGRSAYATTPGFFADHSMTKVPDVGVYSVSVPGAVDGWSTLLSTYGTISLSRALEPAIRYAREGFPVSEIISKGWRESEPKLSADPVAALTFLPGGRAPSPGDVFCNKNLARTLQQIAEGGRDVFYKGSIGAAIIADLKARGGLLDARDLAEHMSDWIEPISTTYRGYTVYELPPNTQGFVALEMLNILEGFDIASLGHNSAEYLHLLVEAKRIAFADRSAHLADFDRVPSALLETLVSKEYAATRRAEIDLNRAAASYRPGATSGIPRGARPESAENLTGLDRGDTVYMTVADREGNAVSFIQSLFAGFGSGLVAGETGIVLHNRGSLFNLIAGHPNEVAPHTRPMHTLIPAFVMKDGKPWSSFGVMGGDHQAQGHVQVLVNLIDFGMNVQEAGEAARVNHGSDGLQVERGVPAAARAGLTARGHEVTESAGTYGGYQGIRIDVETGVLMGGSDPRKDGMAVGY